MRPRLGKLVGENCEEKDTDLKGYVREAGGLWWRSYNMGRKGMRI